MTDFIDFQIRKDKYNEVMNIRNNMLKTKTYIGTYSSCELDTITITVSKTMYKKYKPYLKGILI